MSHMPNNKPQNLLSHLLPELIAAHWPVYGGASHATCLRKYYAVSPVPGATACCIVDTLHLLTHRIPEWKVNLIKNRQGGGQDNLAVRLDPGGDATLPASPKHQLILARRFR